MIFVSFDLSQNVLESVKIPVTSAKLIKVAHSPDMAVFSRRRVRLTGRGVILCILSGTH